MRKETLTRRDFLKLAGLSLGAVAWGPPWPRDPVFADQGVVARVGTSYVYQYAEPDFQSEKIGVLRRDRILRVREIIQSPKGPKRNPRWYRLNKGFAHSGHLQRVDGWRYYTPLESIPQGGQLGEVSVPFTQSMRRLREGEQWAPLYRLYYQAVFWITDVMPGPDERVWYQLTDDLLHVRYYIPAEHMRPVLSEELTPISPEVPAQDKRIEINIAQQRLAAFEGSQMVFSAPVSTGLPSRGPSPNGIPTDTPAGNWHVEVKLPSRHMGDGNLTSDPEAYELPGVPWVSFFHSTGVGMHGTYWHDNFGSQMSHGCVNMRNADALWVYRWTTPTAGPEDWDRKGHGTYVRVT